MGDGEKVQVFYSGKVKAKATGQIPGSPEQPYPVAAMPDGTVRAASHGDYVCGMALSEVDGEGNVLLELDRRAPNEHDPTLL